MLLCIVDQVVTKSFIERKDNPFYGVSPATKALSSYSSAENIKKFLVQLASGRPFQRVIGQKAFRVTAMLFSK